MKCPCLPRRSLPGLLVLAAAACAGDSPSAASHAVALGPGESLAAMECSVSVAEVELVCAGPGTAGARLSLSPAGGAAGDRRIIGGEDEYVHLGADEGRIRNGVLSMTVTVQNLSNLPMATADGSTPNGSGVQVFLPEEPAAQGGGSVTVANASGTASFTGLQQPFFQYGGVVAGVRQDGLDGGILPPGAVSRPRAWEFRLEGEVTSFSFTLYVRTETPPGTLATIAPQVTGISPATLIPGQTATLTGINFHPDPAANLVNVGGVVARGIAGSTTNLSFVVPCTAGGTSTLRVGRDGLQGPGGMPVSVTVQAPGKVLAPGEVAVLGTAELPCWELRPTRADSRYLVTVYNTATTVTRSVGFRLSGNATGAPETDSGASLAAAPGLSGGPSAGTPAPAAGDPHGDLLERNLREYSRLQAHFARDPRMRPRLSVSPAAPVEPPLERTIRVPNARVTNYCSSYYPVKATRVYYRGKVAIYEDADNTPAEFKASSNAAMRDYYTRIGDQFNAGMEPIIRANFGDPLARDAQTDNNGVVVALFTPLINRNFTGLAGFITSCDLFPNDEGAGNTNTSSNFGELFYAYQPTAPGTGYAAFTADQWYRSIRATFIHETKHVASFVARTLNAAPNLEQSWLEEGTARHAEELWAREMVYDLPWRGNHGYGSEADPRGLYCDARPTVCTHPLAPSLNMQRHFGGLYPYMATVGARSPFGATPADDRSTWYAASWSLVRYAIDRYAGSDAAFLTALTQSTTRGTANLAARAGVPFDVLMGGWVSSLAADDSPGLTDAGPDAQVATWNLRAVYGGLNADYPATYPRAYPVAPTLLMLGSFHAPPVAVMYGGGAAWYELSGLHARPQFLRLSGTTSSTPDPSLRIAIVRVQ